MIKLYDGSITDILPEKLASQPRTQALGYAASRAIQRLMDYCKNTSIYASIDTLPEQIIDLLAIELKTPYYDDSMDIEIKRSLVKNTLVWYMHIGTPATVEEAVITVFGNGEVQEWFEYGGEPFYFKVNTSNINTTDEMVQQLTDLISAMKNVRSHLEEITVEVMQQLPLYNGCCIEIVDDSTTIGIDMDV